jgi:hypothetical protein
MKRILLALPVLLISCHHSQIQKKEIVCIDTFFISKSYTPNPDAYVFIIKTDDSLRKAIEQKSWDSIIFVGGIFDTINNNAYNPVNFEKGTFLEPIWTEKKPEDYFIAFGAPFFIGLTQNQVDSLANITIQKVEITIGAGKKIWKIMKCN